MSSGQRLYSPMYDKLVGNELNVKGLLAYGLYKSHKREKIKEFVEKNNKQPSEKDIQKFVNAAMDFSDSFIQKAEQAYAESVGAGVQLGLRRSKEWRILIDDAINAVEKEVGKVEKNYDQSILPLAKKYGAKWWQSVLINIGSALLLPFVLVGILLFIHLCFPGLIPLTRSFISSIL